MMNSLPVLGDIERDTFLSAQEAKEYGLVDQVLESRKAVEDR